MHASRGLHNPGTVLLLLLFLLLPHAALLAAVEPDAMTLPPVSTDTLSARIKETTDSTDLKDEERNKLIDRYRKALSFLEAAEANQSATKAYREARDTAPVETRRLRDKLEAVQKTDAEIEINVTDTSPLQVINQELSSEKANQAAVSAQLTQTEGELARQIERPSKARNRIG